MVSPTPMSGEEKSKGMEVDNPAAREKEANLDFTPFLPFSPPQIGGITRMAARVFFPPRKRGARGERGRKEERRLALLCRKIQRTWENPICTDPVFKGESVRAWKWGGRIPKQLGLDPHFSLSTPPLTKGAACVKEEKKRKKGTLCQEAAIISSEPDSTLTPLLGGISPNAGVCACV